MPVGSVFQSLLSVPTRTSPRSKAWLRLVEMLPEALHEMPAPIATTPKGELSVNQLQCSRKRDGESDSNQGSALARSDKLNEKNHGETARSKQSKKEYWQLLATKNTISLPSSIVSSSMTHRRRGKTRPCERVQGLPCLQRHRSWHTQHSPSLQPCNCLRLHLQQKQ